MKTRGKKIFLVLLCILLLIFILIKCLDYSLQPTPNDKRNISTSDVTIDIQVSDDERKPIVRTYTQEEFSNFDESRKTEIKDRLNSHLEGELPCVNLLSDNKIYFTFLKEENKIFLDETPSIFIKWVPKWDVSEKEPEISDSLYSLDKGKYFYEIHRFLPQYEKYFMERLYVEVQYSIDNEDYISLFYVDSSNAEEETDFFENERLEEPLPAERPLMESKE